LTLKTYNGTAHLEFVRQGLPSTLTQLDILNSYPTLNKQLLTVPALLGKWRFETILYAGITATCPGVTGDPNVSCGANDFATFSSDNTFTQTVPNTGYTTYPKGIWYALNGRLLMDDIELTDSDLSAWIFSVTGDVLTLSSANGGYVISLRRVAN